MGLNPVTWDLKALGYMYSVPLKKIVGVTGFSSYVHPLNNPFVTIRERHELESCYLGEFATCAKVTIRSCKH